MYDYLFKNESYHKYMVQARPKTEKGAPIEVIFTITVAQIVDIDERSQTIKVSVWPQCEWLVFFPLVFSMVKKVKKIMNNQ